MFIPITETVLVYYKHIKALLSTKKYSMEYECKLLQYQKDFHQVSVCKKPDISRAIHIIPLVLCYFSAEEF
jgi:hypothetical protein